MRTPFWAAFFGAVLAAQLHAATRVALVSSCHDETSEKLLAVAEVALSREAGVALVERREIEKVLGEQERNNCGRMDAWQAVKVGRLMEVELFAVLESGANPKEGGAVVIYEAGTGVRLLDEILPANPLEAAATAVAAGVGRAEAKRLRRSTGMLTLGLAAVRNSDMPPELKSWCASVGLLVERQMVQATNLAILERKRLESANRERALPGAQSDKQLLATLVTLELEFSKGEGETGVVAKALLTDAAGKRLATLTATGTKDAGGVLAQRLAEQILQHLNAGTVTVTAGDVQQEAQRFFREASFLDEQGEPEAALQATEAAAALDPLNDGINVKLAERLAEWATTEQQTAEDLDRTIRVARRAHDLLYDIWPRSMAQKCFVYWDCETEYALNYGYLWGRVWPLARGGDAKALRVFQEFREEMRARRLKMFSVMLQRFGDQSGPDWVESKETPGKMMLVAGCAGWWAQITGLTSWSLGEYGRYVNSSQQWTDDTVHLMRLFLEGVKHHQMLQEWEYYGSRLLSRVGLQASGQARIDYLGRLQLQPADLAKLGQLFDEMGGIKDPVIQAFGRIGNFGLTLRGQSGPLDAAGQQRYEAAREFVRNVIANPHRSTNSDERTQAMAVRYAYAAARDLIDLVPDSDFQKREHLALFDWMLARNDVDGWTVHAVCSEQSYRFFHYPPDRKQDLFPHQVLKFTEAEQRQKLVNMDRALAVSRQKNCRYTSKMGSSGSNLGRQLDVLRETFLKKYPDAAPKKSVPWTEAKVLYAAGKNTKLSGLRVFEDAAYISEEGTSKRVLQLPLAGGSAREISSIPDVPEYTADMNIHDGQVCYGTSDGIYLVPLKGGAPTLINKDNGLPVSETLGAALADGNVYAGLEGGYLIRYNLATKKTTVLASASRRDKQTPLDDLTPAFRITRMLNDPERKRILFLVDFPPGTYDIEPMGLWQIDTTTGAISQVYQFYSHPLWMHRQRDGKVLIYFTIRESLSLSVTKIPWMGVVQMNCSNDHAQTILSWRRRDAGPKLPITPLAGTTLKELSYPLFLVDDQLWCWDDEVNKVGRFSFTTRSMEYLPPFDKEDSNQHNVVGYGPIPGKRQMVGATRNKVWLLTLPPPTKETPAQPAAAKPKTKANQ